MIALRRILPRRIQPVATRRFGGWRRGTPWLTVPPRPAVAWEEVAAEPALRSVTPGLSAMAGPHRLTLHSLVVGRSGARLRFSLRPPWLPVGPRPGSAPLPQPAGLAFDPNGARYAVVPGASEGDGDGLAGELLLQPAPPAEVAWLDLTLALDAPRSEPGPTWRLRLPLDGSADGP